MYTQILKHVNDHHDSLKYGLFVVGGFVRDRLLGLDPNDLDYVVMATEKYFEESMPDAVPVGNDFPVYKIGGHDVAITRTERSTGDGYGDFVIDKIGVPINQDLGRRDFTMNSIAIKVIDGRIVDPYNGIHDIFHRKIRTIFPQAFEEDPVRILRGMRFLSRLHTFGFTIDPETKKMMSISAHKLRFVTKERIALEIEKMYKQTDTPSMFFKGLVEIDALKYIMRPLDDCRFVPAGPVKWHGTDTTFDHTMSAIDRVKANGGSFEAFMGALMHDWGKATTPEDILPHHYGHELRSADIAREWLKENRFSRIVNMFVPMAAKYHMRMHDIAKMRPLNKIRFMRKIPKVSMDDFIATCEGDCPLTHEQHLTIDIIRYVLKTATIDTSKCTDKTNVVEYVNRQYLRAYLDVISAQDTINDIVAEKENNERNITDSHERTS